MPKTETPGDDVAAYLAEIGKTFKKEVAFVLTDETVRSVPVIPTGIPGLDNALGCGGIPRGRIIEVYGPESSGKTTLALQLMAQSQIEGDLCHFIDAEHALDVDYAQHLGVNIGRMMISQPDSGEQALEIAEFAAEHGVKFIVIDSVAALVPQAEIDGEMGDSHMGLQARLLSQAMRKLAGVCARNSVTILFINQLRMKIGLVFGNPETTTGGQALKFYASVRIDIRKGAALKHDKDGDAYGQETKVKIVKNKCAPPFRSCTFNLIFGQGYDRLSSLIDLALERNVLEQSGAWIKFGELKWQGRDQLREALDAEPELAQKVAESL